MSEIVDRVSVAVDLDLKETGRQLRKGMDRLAAQDQLRLDVAPDLSGFQAVVDADLARLRPVEVPVRVDDAFARRARRDLQAALKSLDAKLPLTVDGETLRRESAVAARAAQDELARLELEVPLDLADAAAIRARIRAEIEHLQALATADPVKVPVDVDESTTTRLRSALRDLGSRLEPLKIEVDVDRDSLARVTSALGSLGRTGALAGGGIVAAGSLANIAALGPAIAATVGAVGVLPGAAAAAAAGVGALALGVAGFGEAMKNMGDPEKFAESLDRLAPSARAAALAVQSVAPAWRGLQQAVQNDLFAGVAGQITALSSTYLPVLRTGLTGIASAANTAGMRIATSLRSATSVSSVASILGSARTAMIGFGAALAGATPGLLQLSAVSGRVFASLTGGLGDAGRQFSQFIARVSADGSLEGWIRGGLSALQQLGSAARSLGSIVAGVFRAIAAAGGGGLTPLTDGLARVAAIVNGPAFQSGLTDFFQGMRTGMQGVLTGLPAVGSALAAIGPVAGQLASTLGPILGVALTGLARTILALAPSLSTVIAALGPGLGAIVGVLAQVLPQVASALGPVITMIASQLGPVITNLAPRLADVGRAFVGLVQAIAPLASVVLPVLMPALSLLGSVLLGAVRGAIEGVTQVIRGVTQVLSGLVQFVTGVLSGNWSQAWNGLRSIVAGALNAVIGVIRVALNVGILNLLRSGVAALAGSWRVGWDALKAAPAAVLSAVRSVVTGAFGGIRSAVSGGMSGLRSGVSSGWSSIRSAFSSGMSSARSTVSSGWSSLRSSFSSGVSSIRSGVSSGWSSIRSAFSSGMSSARSTVSSGWSSLRSSFSSGVSNVVSTVRQLPGRITGALGNLGTLLFNSGQVLIRGLIDGIMSQLGAVGDAIGSVASTIRGFLPSSPVRQGPLVSWNNGGAGRRLAGLLVTGLDASRDDVRSAADRLASQVASRPAALAPATVGAAVGANTVRAASATPASRGGGEEQPVRLQIVLDGRVVYEEVAKIFKRFEGR